MTLQNNDNIPQDDPQVVKDPETRPSDEGGDAMDDSFEFGFDALIPDDGDDPTPPATDPAEPAGDDDDEDGSDIRHKKLEEEVKALRREKLIDDDVKSLKKKYEGNSMFPKPSKKEILEFIQGPYQKITPMEAGFLLSNIDQIVKNARQEGMKAAEAKYNLSITNGSPEQIKKSEAKMLSRKEVMMKKFGLSIDKKKNA